MTRPRLAARSGRARWSAPAASASRAFALALGAAFLHALWNLLLAKERDPEPATAIAICASVLVFAPVAAVFWDVDSQVWPYLVATSALQLDLLRAPRERVPIRRAVVRLPGRARPGAGARAPRRRRLPRGRCAERRQAVGVCAVGLGVLLVRGIGGERDVVGGVLALTIATTIAGVHARRQVRDPLREPGRLPRARHGAGGARGAPARRGTAFRAGAAPCGAAPHAGRRGVISFVAYVLVLAALRRAPAASVAAVRETSVLIVAVLAAPMLGERVGRGRLVGAALVVAGIALVVL